jgi:transposase
MRYTDAQRKPILATAQKEGLASAQVKKRFGVSTLTFYRWLEPVLTDAWYLLRLTTGRAAVARAQRAKPCSKARTACCTGRISSSGSRAAKGCGRRKIWRRGSCAIVSGREADQVIARTMRPVVRLWPRVLPATATARGRLGR